MAWGLFIFLAIVWGSSFILMKQGLKSFSYAQIGMLRIAFAFIFTSIIGFRLFKLLTKKNWFPLFVVGMLGNGLPYLMFPLAVSKIDSSLVGILNSLVPLFTLIIGLIWFKLKVKWLSVVGIIIGFAGAIWLLMPGLKVDTHTLIYGAYPVLATVFYAISINTIKSKLQGLSSLAITHLSLLFCGVPAIVYILSSDFFEILATDEHAMTNLGYVVILGVIGTSVAVILFNYLIKQTSSIFAASVTYVVPIIALLWGIWDGEDVGMHHAIGMMAILSGVYLVNKRNTPRSR